MTTKNDWKDAVIEACVVICKTNSSFIRLSVLADCAIRIRMRVTRKAKA